MSRSLKSSRGEAGRIKVQCSKIDLAQTTIVASGHELKLNRQRRSTRVRPSVARREAPMTSAVSSDSGAVHPPERPLQSMGR